MSLHVYAPSMYLSPPYVYLLRVHVLRVSLRLYVPPCVCPFMCVSLHVYVPPECMSLRVYVPPCVCPLPVYVSFVLWSPELASEFFMNFSLIILVEKIRGHRAYRLQMAEFRKERGRDWNGFKNFGGEGHDLAGQIS